MQGMTIGKVAQEAGVGVETIRFYERKGLIDQPRKPSGTGFRTYPQATVARIRFIRQAQGLGFSLQQARELLALRADPRADLELVRPKASRPLDDVRDKNSRLQSIESTLEGLISACPGEGPVDCCPILETMEDEDNPLRQGSRNSGKETCERSA